MSAVRAQSLLENGNFDNAGEPLKGWVVDYAWTKNSYYIGNKDHVSIATEGARKNVVNFGDAGDGGVKMERRSRSAALAPTGTAPHPEAQFPRANTPLPSSLMAKSASIFS